MGQTWEADKMLDVYIYDYLVKRNLQATAKSFMAEGKVATGPVAIDAPGGFLFEWWSVFWDIFIARTNENHSDAAAAYFEVQQMKNKEQLLLQQYQLMQQRQAVQLHQLRNANRPALNGPISDGLMGSSAASPLAANVYGEHLKNPNSINSESLKSVGGHPGQLVQGHAGNINSALQQIQGRNQQSTDIRPGAGVSPRSLPGDPSTLYGQRVGQGKSGLGGSPGLHQGASGSAMLDGWPLTSEQMRPLVPQAPRPILQSSNQYQVLTAEQQQLIAQTHLQGNIGNSHGFGGMDPQRFRALQRAGLNVKDGQPNGNDGQVGSPLQTSLPMVKNEQAELLMKMRMAQMSMAQKPQDQMLQQHQLQQNNRKRKPSSSGAANSSGPSSSQPSTPSTNTQGDGVATGNDMPHANSMPKSSMIYGTDGTRALGSSSNHMDDLENLGDIGALDDQMDSFFSQDGDGRDLFAQNSPAENNANTSKEHGGEQNHGLPRT